MFKHFKYLNTENVLGTFHLFEEILQQNEFILKFNIAVFDLTFTNSSICCSQTALHLRFT